MSFLSVSRAAQADGALLGPTEFQARDLVPESGAQPKAVAPADRNNRNCQVRQEKAPVFGLTEAGRVFTKGASWHLR